MLLFLLISGCAQVEDVDRAALVHAFLLRDNAVWLSREPSLLAAKYERMAGHPYDLMRGSAGLFYEDIARVGRERTPTAFGHGDAATVLLIGDAHPENLGTIAPDLPPTEQGLSVRLLDVDAATWGPYSLDVRRSAQGLGMLLVDLPGCEIDCRDAAVAALAQGYLDAIEALDAGIPVNAGDGGRAIRELVDEAVEEGTERKRLLEDTEDGPDGRRWILGPGILEATTPEEQARIDAVLTAWDAPDGFRVLDTARRFGQGVSSMAAYRFYVLWDRGQPGDEDDDLLQIREVVDPPTVPGALPTVPGLFATQADRIDGAHALAWPEPDPLAAAVSTGNLTWKTLSRSSWFQGLDRTKVREAWDAGDLDQPDLDALGRLLGTRLAEAHARGTTSTGTPALDVIAPDLADRGGAFVRETLLLARADVALGLSDLAVLRDLLDDFGPLLGADTLQEIP